MNRLHNWLCGSTRWRKTIERRVPWALAGADLGANVLEVGPGPGLTTDLLRLAVSRLTAIEIDLKLAESLGSRLRGSNVDVVTGDATAMPFSDAQFSGGVSFTMLHHVSSTQLQDRLLREVWRVFGPGGGFVGGGSARNGFMRVVCISGTHWYRSIRIRLVRGSRQQDSKSWTWKRIRRRSGFKLDGQAKRFNFGGASHEARNSCSSVDAV